MSSLFRTLGVALLAALLWLGIGLFQRSGSGVPLGEAVAAELPLTAVVFVVALLWIRLRRPQA